MNNPYLPEGTDLRDIEGRRPVHRSENTGIGAGSIDDSTEQERRDFAARQLDDFDDRRALREALQDV